MPDICCIGNIVADAIARTVDRWPEPGRLVMFDSLTLATGGNGLNVAIDLAKLGVTVALMGRVGCDAFGDFLLAEARTAGVDVGGVVRDPSAGTSVAFVAVTSRGERSFFHTLGANARVNRADIDMRTVASSRALLVSSFLLPGFDGPDTAAVLREAKAAGVTTFWDAVANEAVDAPALAREALRFTDWCIPSELEAQLVVPAAAGNPSRMARELQNLGAANVVVKLAERGCLIRDQTGRELHVPAYQADPVVDATGAGDAWAAGFMTGLLRGWDPVRAAELGHAVAADCISAVGASRGIRPLDQVLSAPPRPRATVRAYR